LIPVARWKPMAPAIPAGPEFRAPDALVRSSPNAPASALARQPGRSSMPLTAITPPIASEPHSADCGPRTTSTREARSALRISNRGVSPEAGSSILMPSTNSKV